MLIKYRILRRAGYLTRIKEDKRTFKIVTGKRSLGKPKRRWEDNIRMDLKMGVSMRDWIEAVQDRDFWKAPVNAKLSLWVS